MRRAALLALGLLLAACSQGEPSGGGRPDLPETSRVAFPAAPGGASVYLSLLTDDGQTLYQRAVPAGATEVSVSPAQWLNVTPPTVPALTLVPDDAQDVRLSDPGARIALFHWTLWQDANADGRLQNGEALDLMTHDRVAYASAAFTLTFQDLTPDMQERWTLPQGWSRASHYVYLPKGSTTYRRSVDGVPTYDFTLHTPTPVTSM